MQTNLDKIIERMNNESKLEYKPACFLYDELLVHFYRASVMTGLIRYKIYDHGWSRPKEWSKILTDKFMLLDHFELGVCGTDPVTGKFIKDVYFDFALFCYFENLEPGTIDQVLVDNHLYRKKPYELKYLTGMIYELSIDNQIRFTDAYHMDKEKNFKNL